MISRISITLAPVVLFEVQILQQSPPVFLHFRAPILGDANRRLDLDDCLRIFVRPVVDLRHEDVRLGARIVSLVQPPLHVMQRLVEVLFGVMQLGQAVDDLGFHSFGDLIALRKDLFVRNDRLIVSIHGEVDVRHHVVYGAEFIAVVAPTPVKHGVQGVQCRLIVLRIDELLRVGQSLVGLLGHCRHASSFFPRPLPVLLSEGDTVAYATWNRGQGKKKRREQRPDY